MIDVERAPLASARRRSGRLAGLLRSILAAMLSPAMVLSMPLVNLVGRQRRRAQRWRATGLSLVPGRADVSPSWPGTAPKSGSTERRGPAVTVAGAELPPGVTVRDDGRFSTVRVESTFNPRLYGTVFALLQVPLRYKLLDLTPATVIVCDLFERLAAAWTAEPGTVPRLGILLSFDRWVLLRENALRALQPIAANGVKIEVFYAEQAEAGRLDAWFSHGQLVHNIPAAIQTLVTRWHPSANWSTVIETLARLARAHSLAVEVPELLTHLAALALSCGGSVQAATLATEALHRLPHTPSATRSRALRELGAALLGQGQTETGLALLDEAIAVAAAAQDVTSGATALCQSGMYALNHEDFANAETRFRRAIELLRPARRGDLLAQAHHNLAVALMELGSDEAEHHAATALALRPDKSSPLAEEDRILLGRMREAREN